MSAEIPAIEIARAAELPALLAGRPRGAPPLVPRGLGTRIGTRIGDLPRDGEALSLAALAGIEELDAEEMVLTALAGTPIDAAARDAAAAGLLLCPLLPPGTPGTFGGLHSSGDESPAAPLEGRVRDAVLGLEAVTGAGGRLRGGGRVVKNVTGYDLTRFLSGSRGTLAVITRVHWRLRRRPERFLEVAVRCLPAEITALLLAVRRAPDPTALKVELAAGSATVRALVEGSEAAAGDRAGRIARSLGAPEGAAEVPLGALAAWLDPGAGETLRGSAREIAEALARLGEEREARAVAFPYTGFARVAGPARGGSADAAPTARADPFEAAARRAWDPDGRLWRGGGTR